MCGPWFGGLWILISGVVLVGLIFWILRRLTRQNGNTKKSRALEVARKKYARGEISEEEYAQITKDLL